LGGVNVHVGDGFGKLERAEERVPAFDLDGFLAVVAAFIDQTVFDQSPNDACVGLIQDPSDVSDGEVVIGEKVANRCLAFEGRIQPRGVGRQNERLGS
jgi:hypothetical protein